MFAVEIMSMKMKKKTIKTYFGRRKNIQVEFCLEYCYVHLKI